MVGYSVVVHYVVGYSGQTWTEYPLHIISYIIRGHSIVGYSRRWVFLMSGIPYSYRWAFPLLGIPLLGIPVILPGKPNDQNTQLFYWVFRSLGIPAVGYSHCWVFRTVTALSYAYSLGSGCIVLV